MCIKDICVIIQKYFRKCRNIFADIAINIAFRDREIACRDIKNAYEDKRCSYGDTLYLLTCAHSCVMRYVYVSLRFQTCVSVYLFFAKDEKIMRDMLANMTRVVF